MDKFRKILENPMGRLVFDLFLALIGFALNMVDQISHNRHAEKVLNELGESAIENIEQVKSLFSTLNAPGVLNGFIFAILFFFFGMMITNIILSKEPQDSPMLLVSNGGGENIITELLKHLSEQVYNRCSNVSSKCKDCHKFAEECNGLIRRYLYEETKHLQVSISNSEEGQYVLDSNIPVFHTIAIDHLIDANSNQYSVIQYIGSKEYTEKNKYDETYDSLDYDFLHILLSKVIDVSESDGKPYYKRDLQKEQKGETAKFKIKWLLIGDIDCMKNNYDYIFYVIDSLKDGSRNIVKEFFEIYVISEEEYKNNSILKLRRYASKTCDRVFDLSNKPSFGIFGDMFMFVDATNAKSHGTMYTREYNPENKREGLLETSIDFFEYIIKLSKQVDMQNLYDKYDKICKNDSTWKEKLRTAWEPDNKRSEAI